MVNKMTYDAAFNKLKVLVAEIENDEIQLDSLAVKVKEANELIKYCETKLRSIDNDINGQVE